MNFNILISELREREPQAQRYVVDTYSPYLYQVSYRYTNNTEDAKDILQDTLVNVINKIHKFQGNEIQFKAWIKKICINNALSKKRKMSYAKEVYLGKDTRTGSANPSIIGKLNMQDILKLLSSLPQQQRAVFNLNVIDGFRHTEISKILDIKESTSRTLLTRAKQKMQELILRQQKIRLAK